MASKDEYGTFCANNLDLKREIQEFKKYAYARYEGKVRMFCGEKLDENGFWVYDKIKNDDELDENKMYVYDNNVKGEELLNVETVKRAWGRRFKSFQAAATAQSEEEYKKAIDAIWLNKFPQPINHANV